MDLLANVLGITLFVLVIALSIALHEWGHFATAKRFGVKVTEFFIGFGPRLWSRRRGETTYGLKAIPLGGYVRIIGMYPPSKAPAVEGRARAARLSAADSATTPDEGSAPAGGGPFRGLMEDARAQAMAEIEPGDEDRVFYKLPTSKRVAVMMAGPGMNLVIAFVLFTIMLVGVGLPQPTTTIREIVPCVPTVENPFGDTDAGGACPGSVPSPAVAAGLRAGDRVERVDGIAVTEWDALTSRLAGARAGDAVRIEASREGDSFTTTATLALAEYPVLDSDGEPTGEVRSSPFLGVRPDAEYVPLSVGEVPGYMWEITTLSVKALVTLPVRLYELVEVLVTGQERPLDGPVSVVGVSRLGGEIAALDEPVKAKVGSFLGLAASLNLFLFLFNLVPLLPLDGGHVAAAGYESVRRRWARARGRADPGPVDTVRMLPVTYAIVILLVTAGAIVIYADLVNPISIGG